MENKDCVKNIRKNILWASYCGHDGNLQSSFSCVEILWTLYSRVLRLGFSTVHDVNRDKFVLSKGQANLCLMSVLAEKGYLNKNELDTFCKFNSRISMQADRTKFEGYVENSAGSLGHGLPIAVGMAWANKILDYHGCIYVLVGDGEMNEGTMWEACLFAASEHLDNLIVIIDDNDSVGKMLNMGNIEAKMLAFGFEVDVVNGHNLQELCDSLSRHGDDRPKVIIAHTQRGYGCKTLMEDRSWFHRAPNENEFYKLMKEVDVF